MIEHQWHRSDIDGLRAVAILGVLGYHTRWLPGGFTGVDIFFVISGYLISGVIFHGLERGTFSFADFYARRIKRIFPALFTMLLCVAIFGWYWLLADEYVSLGKHIAAGAAFVANIVLWKEASYFDPAVELKPLLHLWSLGIEEQFYLGWPLLCVIAWKRRLSLTLVILGIALASFALNIAWYRGHEIGTFYLLPARIWELALGALLACAQYFARPESGSVAGAFSRQLSGCGSAAVGNALALAGLALVGVAAVSITNRDLFPGWLALLPTLGAVLLIAAGANAWVNRRILANPLLVWVGLISYPLYLWHWPLLSFQRILAQAPLTKRTTLLTLAVAFVLAWLTYRFIEKPIRSQRARLVPSAALSGGIAALAGFGWLCYGEQLAPRSAAFGLNRFIPAANLVFPGHLRTLLDADVPVYTQGEGRTAVLFVGDSEMQQYYVRIDWLLTHDPRPAKRVIYSVQGGCPPLPHVKEDHLPLCNGLVGRDLRLALDPTVDTVVVAADWVGYFLGVGLPEGRLYYYQDATTKGPLTNALGSAAVDRALAAFRSMIATLAGAGKKVYIVLPSPTGVELSPRHMVQRRLTRGDFQLRIPVVSRSFLETRARPVVDRLMAIARATGARAIDPLASLCGETTCPVVTEAGQPIYRDEGHLDAAYTREHVVYLDAVMQ